MDRPRFVILHHVQAQGEHWDLMLQTGAVLATWRLAALPDANTGRAVPAEAIGDHRLDYLTYEGPLSRDRGSVRRIDEGRYALLEQVGTHWTIDFQGRILRGTWRLNERELRRI